MHQLVWESNIRIGQKFFFADEDYVAVKFSGHSAAGRGLKIGYAAQFNLFLFCALYDCPRKRVLALGFHRCRNLQKIAFTDGIRGDPADYLRFTGCQCACFVRNQVGDFFSDLDRLRVFYQDPSLCSATDADHD